MIIGEGDPDSLSLTHTHTTHYVRAKTKGRYNDKKSVQVISFSTTKKEIKQRRSIFFFRDNQSY
jgi:hypothetical protein